jgi:GTP-binding protein YchF
VEGEDAAMRLGIIGLPYVGKTCLFNALCRAHAATGEFGHEHAENIGVVGVPDPRLDFLHSLYPDKKKVHAHLELMDFPGLVKGSSSDKAKVDLIAHMRLVDGFVHVVRVFDDPRVAHVSGTVDPSRDVDDLRVEFLVSDLDQTEKRLAKVAKTVQHAKTREAEVESELLLRIREALDNETAVRDVEMTPEEERVIRGFQMLTAKPMVYALNVAEGASAQDDESAWAVLAPRLAGPRCAYVELSAKLEMELSELEPDDAEAFLRELGMEESGASKLLRVCQSLLGLITFFTIGKDEVRGWQIAEGTEAKQAAGAIHTDMEKGFIRAEVIHIDALREAGSMDAAKARNLVRLEKKDHVIADGDIVQFRFS